LLQQPCTDQWHLLLSLVFCLVGGFYQYSGGFL